MSFGDALKTIKVDFLLYKILGKARVLCIYKNLGFTTCKKVHNWLYFFHSYINIIFLYKIKRAAKL